MPVNPRCSFLLLEHYFSFFQNSTTPFSSFPFCFAFYFHHVAKPEHAPSLAPTLRFSFGFPFSDCIVPALSSSTERDYYRVLGVPEYASQDEIKKAFPLVREYYESLVLYGLDKY